MAIEFGSSPEIVALRAMARENRRRTGGQFLPPPGPGKAGPGLLELQHAFGAEENTIFPRAIVEAGKFGTSVS